MGFYVDAVLTLFRTSSRYLVVDRLSLLVQTTKIFLKNLLLVKWLKQRVETEKIFGFTWLVGDYSIFWRIFIDLFIRNHYYFTTQSKAPKIIDCGSHIGLSVLYFNLLYPESEITAIEPNPGTFSLLKQNVKNNHLGRVKLINMAIADKYGEGVLLINPDIKADWATKLEIAKQTNNLRLERVTVKTIALSRIVNKNSIDLLKIDIEGAEERAISDLAKNNLMKKIKVFIIEYHCSPESQKNKNRLSAIIAAFEDNSFSYYIHYPLRYKWGLWPSYLLFRYLAASFNFLIYAQRED